MQHGIEYVVVTSSGVTQSGFLFGEDNDRRVEVSRGSKISLHLGQGQIYQILTSGSDLIVVFADGSRLVLEGFRGLDAELFTSTNGTLQTIRISDASSEEGAPLSFYVLPIETQTLEDPYGALVFAGDAEVVETATGSFGLFLASQQFLPVGLVGAGIGTLLAGGSEGTTADPKESAPNLQIDNILGQAVVSGAAAPGSVVLVALNGQTLSARADAEGLWSVTFSGDRLPPDGTYQASVVTCAPDGQISESQSNAGVIDFAGPEVQILAGAASVGDIETAADYVDGITLRGTGEPFAEIEVTISGEVARTVIAADGTWQVTFSRD